MLRPCGLSSFDSKVAILTGTTALPFQSRLGSSVRLGTHEKRHVYEWDDFPVERRVKWDDWKWSAWEDLQCLRIQELGVGFHGQLWMHCSPFFVERSFILRYSFSLSVLSVLIFYSRFSRFFGEYPLRFMALDTTFHATGFINFIHSKDRGPILKGTC